MAYIGDTSVSILSSDPVLNIANFQPAGGHPSIIFSSDPAINMACFWPPGGPKAKEMTPLYLKNEPHASAALRHLANGLNQAAYHACCSRGKLLPPHIGFDLEWKPNFRADQPENPVAVIQIAYMTSSYVIHVRWMRALPDGLVEILQNPRVVKVGVGIQNDAKKLYRDLGVSLTSCVDLSLLVKCVDAGLFTERLDRYQNVPQSSPLLDPTPPPDTPLSEFYKSEAFLGPHIHRLFRGSYSTAIGLARLAETYCGLILTKGKITRSNWDAELNVQQLNYAALDAYAGYIVYARLIHLLSLLPANKRPMRKFYAFDCIRGTFYHCCGEIRRTLLGEPMEDSDGSFPFHNLYPPAPPTFYPVEDEISLHMQGVGSDQPLGLVPWTPSNPEYDPGPLPPKKTKEEKEEAWLARQKRRDEQKKVGDNDGSTQSEQKEKETKAARPSMKKHRSRPEANKASMSTTMPRPNNHTKNFSRAAGPKPLFIPSSTNPDAITAISDKMQNMKTTPISRSSDVEESPSNSRPRNKKNYKK